MKSSVLSDAPSTILQHMVLVTITKHHLKQKRNPTAFSSSRMMKVARSVPPSTPHILGRSFHTTSQRSEHIHTPICSDVRFIIVITSRVVRFTIRYRVRSPSICPYAANKDHGDIVTNISFDTTLEQVKVRKNFSKHPIVYADSRYTKTSPRSQKDMAC